MQQYYYLMMGIGVLAIFLLLGGSFPGALIQCEMTGGTSCGVWSITGYELIGDQQFITDDSNTQPIYYNSDVNLDESTCTISGSWSVSDWGDCSGSGTFSFNGFVEWINNPWMNNAVVASCHTNANPEITLSCGNGAYPTTMGAISGGADVYISSLSVDFYLDYSPIAYCGDGTCDDDETQYTCPSDCGIPIPDPYCGDGVCNGDETCSTCEIDCGACTPICGDGVCNGDETCSSCSIDCGVCDPYCGDGTCNGLETCEICSLDCGDCPPEPIPNPLQFIVDFVNSIINYIKGLFNI